MPLVHLVTQNLVNLVHLVVPEDKEKRVTSDVLASLDKKEKLDLRVI